MKLSKRFYEPFKIIHKISDVAYKMQRPKSTTVYPMFHIGLLKPMKGDTPESIALALPPLIINAHPDMVPAKTLAHRVIKRANKDVPQVLIIWLGLLQKELSWEDLNYISHLVPTMNLQDKVKFAGGDDVMNLLDLEEVVRILREDLGILEDPTPESSSIVVNFNQPTQKERQAH